MSNLLDHANRELDLLGYPQITREDYRAKMPQGGDAADVWYDKQIRIAVIQLITDFSKQGHSGSSAGMVISMVTRLMQYQNLSPLTDCESEWMHIAEDIAGEANVWQNRRRPEAFSNDGGKTYYLLGDEQSKWVKWTKTHLPIWLRSLVWSRTRNPIHMLKLRKSDHADAVRDS